MKIITMYLPQFHRVKENDEWWGEGFTEWTAVRQAKALFEHHDQPRIPQSEDYYDLLDKKTMQKQYCLMKQYQIYGQCFYHYWFKEGRKILEKPAENLLKWNDIHMPFCFCWDSGSWVRTWSGIQNANTWVRKFDRPKKNESESGVLLEQDYGNRQNWREHFTYLFSFFKDERYIKINGKPIFIFYRPEEIYCLEEMTDYWQELAQQEGLPGLYLIGTNCTPKNCLDAVYWQEPRRTFSRLAPSLKKTVKCYDSDIVWKRILSEKPASNMNVYFGGMVGYDDTPRKGTAGLVLINNSPEKFELYLSRLIKKNEDAGNDFVFLNAWNEWSEGTYLEPDEKNGEGYLRAVKNAMESYHDIKEEDAISGVQVDDQLIVMNERYKKYLHMLNRWLEFKEKGIALQDSFLDRGWKKIAVYGIGMLGIHLIRELEGSQIQILYGIDQHADAVRQNFPVIFPSDQLRAVDVIVITAIADTVEISRMLHERTHIPIISLEQFFV